MPIRLTSGIPQSLGVGSAVFSTMYVLRSNDSNLSCPSNLAAPHSEVQAELCGPTSSPKGQLQILVRPLKRGDISLPAQ
jgi:hypothetical protein